MASRGGAINIYARLRKIMPWEDNNLSATAVDGYKILNRTSKREQSYEFTRVFTPSDDNIKCHEFIGKPLLNEVLHGYNAILMAYGQTGSGKTYSILGKVHQHNKKKNKSNTKSVKGLLTLSLEYLLKQPNVSYLEISAVETFGHHIQKIRLFDLGDINNSIEQWDKKQPMKSSKKIKNANKIKLNEHNILETIERLHSSSHFAPTGKNPESSRGHICYVTTVHLKYFKDDEENGINQTLSPSQDLIAHWIVVDLAGSEGESAITDEFQKTAEPSEVMARRLEAWCINHGLSQLQIIFNELRGIKKKGASQGQGLRKTLSEFISNRSFISVLFTISPSQDNSKSTEATLRFAESAALVKCTPVKTQKKVNKDTLIAELRNFIQQQQNIIDEKNNKIIQLEQQVLDSYLLEHPKRDDSNTNTPIIKQRQKLNKKLTHTAKDDDMNHSLDIDTTPNFENSLTPLTFNNIDKKSNGYQLPTKLIKQLNQFQQSMDEEKKQENIWQATKSQYLSLADEEDLEQSMKEQMSDIRRASRVSADVQFVSQILSLSNHADIGFNEDVFKQNGGNININRSSITSLKSYKHNPRFDTIIETDHDDSDSFENPKHSYLIKKILHDHNNGYQVHNSTLQNLNKSQLMYLCTIFAKNSNSMNHRFQDETDKIIQSHEEQIQFLTKELNRLQRYHQHSHSLSLKSDIHINMIMDDIDEEKFEPSMTEYAKQTENGINIKKNNNREESPSSSRIDPMAAMSENSPLVATQQNGAMEKNHIITMNKLNLNDNNNDKVVRKQRNTGMCSNCVIL